MARIERYRQIVRELLTSRVDNDRHDANSAIECKLICDSERDSYLLLDIG
jgi:hypothetical protein